MQMAEMRSLFLLCAAAIWTSSPQHIHSYLNGSLILLLDTSSAETICWVIVSNAYCIFAPPIYFYIEALIKTKYLSLAISWKTELHYIARIDFLYLKVHSNIFFINSFHGNPCHATSPTPPPPVQSTVPYPAYTTHTARQRCYWTGRPGRILQ